MASSAAPKPRGQAALGEMVYTVKITLRGSRPPIWRRLEIPASVSLTDLHDVIQVAFGWEDYHMWVFETGQARYGVPDDDLEIASADAKRLDQVVPKTGGRLRYTYDFGDDWEHDLLVENIAPAESNVAYPRCLTGRRAGPPEDCGGIWGYQSLIEILADPTHEEHEERLEWLGLDSGDELDPAAFDVAEVNEGLSRLAKVLVKV